ncbi:hypothetical protein QM480_18430 [Flectobacillus sp. DC10W]|uniref:Uncharacterized protein n=1 Tax=Flectobacillus longus TaxID=2984207 RepID=A0ABT6YTA3_9BACT|nr:hypothetical protein [Flectobacillus longus]MDI9866323.1 hypothetical protein [Flectobacillus longus]
MNELQKNWLEPVEELYNSPELKFLIGGLGIMIPFVSVADSVIGASINKLKQKRLKTFFDELNQGDIVLTEEQIKSDDFLNAYFETANYVLRTKSDEKIKRFALILKRVYSNDLTIEDFDDYIKVFDDLTDREFAILNVKYRFEQENVANPNGLNPFQLSESYWANFKNEVANKLNIP